VRIPFTVTKYKSSTSYSLCFVNVRLFFFFEFTKRSAFTERISANFVNFHKLSFLKQVHNNVLSKLEYTSNSYQNKFRLEWENV